MPQPITALALGIDLQADGEAALFKWLLASFLMGKRIRATAAMNAYRVIVDKGRHDTPRALIKCTHRDLVRMLGEGGYARYDESTARRLHALAAKLANDYEGTLSHMRGISSDLKDFERRLLEFEGIGPKTVEIFMREARAVLE